MDFHDAVCLTVLCFLELYSVLKSKPNAAHRVLAHLLDPDKLHSLAPKAESFHLITQNIDGLSRKVMPEETQDTDRIIEMHGRLMEVQCTSEKRCGYSEIDYSSPIARSLQGNEDLDLSGDPENYPEIALEELPRCKKCGRLARPGVVWFGETPRQLDRIDGIVDKADMCLVVGTSATVRSTYFLSVETWLVSPYHQALLTAFYRFILQQVTRMQSRCRAEKWPCLTLNRTRIMKNTQTSNF